MRKRKKRVPGPPMQSAHWATGCRKASTSLTMDSNKRPSEMLTSGKPSLRVAVGRIQPTSTPWNRVVQKFQNFTHLMITQSNHQRQETVSRLGRYRANVQGRLKGPIVVKVCAITLGCLPSVLGAAAAALEGEKEKGRVGYPACRPACPSRKVRTAPLPE